MKQIRKRKWFYTLLLCIMVCVSLPATGQAASKISLNKASLSVMKGKSAILKLSGTTKKVTWSSSKKSVATVNSAGKVTGKKKGTAVITAKVGSKKYRCNVTVKQPVTSVRLNQKSIAISVGKTYKLKATTGPTSANTRSVKWSTSNKSVVTVSSAGQIKAVKPGTAVIRATAKDGSGKKAECKILVKTPVTANPKATVSLDKTAVTLKVGETQKLTATTSDGTKVAWGSSDPSVASVSGGTVTAKKAGTATIAARRIDGQKTVFCKVTVAEKEAERPSQAGESKLARQYLQVLQKYSDRIKSDKAAGIKWAYSNDKAKSTWSDAVKSAQANGITYCNCALLARWGLRELKIINSKNFWGLVGGEIQYRGDVKDQLLKHCEIIRVFKTPNQLLAEGNLLPGDICSWVEYQHTNVYAGDGLWYDSGRSGAVGSYQGGTFIFDSFGPAATVNMSGSTIGYIIRLVK